MLRTALIALTALAALVACAVTPPSALPDAVASAHGASRPPPTLVVTTPRVMPGGVIEFEVQWANDGPVPRTLHFGACAAPLAQLRNNAGRVDVVIGEGGGGIGVGGSCVDTPADTVVGPGERVHRSGQLTATTRTTSPFAQPPVEDVVEPLSPGTYRLVVTAPRTDGEPGSGELLSAEVVVVH